jgi:DNA-directed RNA polymerase subunit M/transcription elongation factor TFIIS
MMIECDRCDSLVLYTKTGEKYQCKCPNCGHEFRYVEYRGE